MINGVADISLQIGTSIYRLKDLYSKTIYATKALNVYSTPSGKKIVATIKAGDPIGIIQGYYPKGRNGSVDNFLIVGPTTKDNGFVKYSANNFSEYKLAQQGTKTQKQKAEEDTKEEQPWYMKLTGQILPWAVLGFIGYKVLDGQLKNGK